MKLLLLTCTVLLLAACATPQYVARPADPPQYQAPGDAGSSD